MVRERNEDFNIRCTYTDVGAYQLGERIERRGAVPRCGGGRSISAIHSDLLDARY